MYVYIVADNIGYSSEYSELGFIEFYFGTFGYDCGNPKSIAESLVVDNSCYLGRGYTVTKQSYQNITIDDNKCKHPNKYLNRISSNLSFMVCPACKQEV